MMLDGIRKIAPTGVMLMFAILYFGVMIDAGLFDPIVGRILRAVKGDPLKIVVGTTVLALVISLDGDGSTTYMIVVASMLPLYRRLKMNPLSMTCLAMLASGIMNLTPWGGPTARAASALHVDVGDIFVPLVPVMGVAIVALLALAFALGLKERRRLGVLSLPDGATLHAGYDEDGPKNLPEIEVDQDLRRPRLLWVNAGLTLALMVSLVMGVLPLPVLFMIAFAIALIINYRTWPSSAAAWRSTRATCCRWCRLSSPPASSPASCRARAWSRPCRAACWPCSLTPWVRTWPTSPRW